MAIGRATTEPALRTCSQAERRFWLRLALAILTIKNVLLALDHAPMFFLGDSVAYLNTAKWGWIPTDRSFLYGWLIRYLAFPVGSLLPLLIAQSLAGAAASLGSAFILRRYFAASRPVAAAMGIACAVEPLQLLFERYVMTEPFSLAAFVLFVVTALDYAERATLGKLLRMQGAAVLVIAMRVSFLPIVEAATVLTPLLALGKLPRLNETFPARAFPGPWRRVLLHAACSCIFFLGLQGAYKQLYAHLIRDEIPNAGPAYNYDGGFHLLAFVAPVVKPIDFPHPEKAAAIFQLAYDLHDPRLRFRQRWDKGGLVENLRAAYPDHMEANRLAEQTAWNAVMRDPLGELRLTAFGFADYFNREHLRLGMIDDRGGDRELPDELLSMLRTDFRLEGKDLPHLVTLTNRYYFAAWGWFLALLFLPIPALLAVGIVPPRQRPAALLLFIFAALQIAVVAAFSIGPTVRFLHAVAWMSTLVGGIFLHWCTRKFHRAQHKKVRPAVESTAQAV